MDQGDTEKVAKVTENLFPGTQNLFFPGIQNLFFPETQNLFFNETKNLFFPGTKNLFPGIQNLFSRANLISRERGGVSGKLVAENPKKFRFRSLESLVSGMYGGGGLLD